MVGAWCFLCCWAYWLLCWIFFALVFSCMYCWVLIFDISHFYFLIYMYLEMNHGWCRDFSCKPNIYVSWSISELNVRLVPWNLFKPSSGFLANSSKAVLLVLFIFIFALNVMSVSCSLVVTYWVRANLLAPLYVMFLVFCHFPILCLGSGVVLDCVDSWV